MQQVFYENPYIGVFSLPYIDFTVCCISNLRIINIVTGVNMEIKSLMAVVQRLILLLTFLSNSLYAQTIFKNGFEQSEIDPLAFVTTWQDDQDSNGFYDILASDSEFTFPDIIANAESGGNQLNPVIAVAANGSFVVAWEDDIDNNGFFQIWARGFHADGSQRFSRITVNTEAAGQQRNPDIAMNPNGDFVVVWEDDKDGNGRFNILGRGFNANGSQKFSDRKMAYTGEGASIDPAISMADDGSFVVTWSDDLDYNGFYQIKARGFNSNGSNRFNIFTVNSQGAGQQVQPDIALAANGNFVITWADDQDGNWFYEIFARGFFANGTQRFSDITLNSPGTASQYRPAVGIADDGSFAATWVDQEYRIMWRQFDATGNPTENEIELNSNVFQLQNRPTIGVTQQNEFIVLWDQLDDNGYFTLKGREMDNQGNKGEEFSPSSVTNGDQSAPSIGVR